MHHASATAVTRGKMGEHAEKLACDYLVRHGLTLLQRNYRCVRGEIDLIMRDGADLVFVEVRYRRKPWFGSGAESVTRHKRAKLIATASHYLQAVRLTDRQPSRFDVVSVSPEAGRDDKIEWIQDAFQA